MLFHPQPRDEFSLSPLEIESWLPTAPRLGDEKIMQLRAPQTKLLPSALRAFDKHQSVARADRPNTFLHFYVSDQKLLPIFRNPQRYVYRFSQFGGIIGPDLSVYRKMAPSSRTFHISANRALTRFFQDCGIPTIPNIRWAVESDFTNCFLGIPETSNVAISTHGCCQTIEDRSYLRAGLLELIKRVRPTNLLVHGRMPSAVFFGIGEQTSLLQFPSDVALAHGSQIRDPKSFPPGQVPLELT